MTPLNDTRRWAGVL